MLSFSRQNKGVEFCPYSSYQIVSVAHMLWSTLRFLYRVLISNSSRWTTRAAFLLVKCVSDQKHRNKDTELDMILIRNEQNYSRPKIQEHGPSRRVTS